MLDTTPPGFDPSAPTASVGSETLSPSENGHNDFVALASTSGACDEEEEEQEEEEVVVMADVLGNVICSFEDDLPIISGGITSFLKDPLNEDGRVEFSENLRVTFDPSKYDAPPDADAVGGSRDGTRNNTEQLFKSHTGNALRDVCGRFEDVESNGRMVAGTMDGLLVHSNFLSKKTKEKTQTNISLVNSMTEQKNQIAHLTNQLSHIGGCVGSVRNELKDDIDGVRTEVSNIGNKLVSMETAMTTAMTTGQNELKTMMMTLMTQNAASAVAASAPVPAPAPAQVPAQTPAQTPATIPVWIQAQPQIQLQSYLNPSTTSFKASTFSAITYGTIDHSHSHACFICGGS
jgi:hypothetical protein